ncbi:MAG TPA: DUF1499 domain-containing protein [Smithellaceae bacterium]|nr:DUF1499 domain-containing protein [Smithellaceae bacterium]
MKTFYLILVTLVALVVISLVGLTFLSRAPKGSLINGRLKPCRNTPHCVSSESDEDASKVEPLPYTEDSRRAWRRIRSAILKTGGHVQKDEGHYLWATYTSRFLRFVDDVELRLDEKERVIHIRSASRIGRSDRNINRKRVDMLRAAFSSRKD